MRYPNTAQLKGWLEDPKNGLTVLAAMDAFELDNSEYERHLAELEKGARPKKEWLDAAAFRCLTMREERSVPRPAPKPEQILIQQDQILKAYKDQVDEQRRIFTSQQGEFAGLKKQISDAENHLLGSQTHIDARLTANLQQFSSRMADVEKSLTANHQATRGHVEAVVSNLHEKAQAQTFRYRVVIVGLIVLLCVILFAGKAHAQNVNEHIVVATCGTPPSNYPSAGSRAPGTVDVNGNECAGVSVSATVATAGLAISVSVGASSSGVPVTPSGGVASTSAPTWSNGTIVPFSFETDGDLRVAASVTPPALQNVNVTQVLSQPAATNGNGVLAVAGATSAGLIVQGSTSGAAVQVNFLTAAPNVTVANSSITVTDGAGALNTIVDSGTLTAVTSITNAVTVTDGAGALNVIVDSSALPSGAATEATLGGVLTTSAFNASLGTAGTADSQVQSIQGIASMTPVQIQGNAASGATPGNPVLVSALSGSVQQSLAVSTVNGGLRVTPSGYTSSVAWGSSVNLAVTNTALVTVASGTRIVLHRANFLCGSTVSAAVTVSLGFATATLPSSGAGLIWAGMVTSASSFQGLQDGAGFPNVLGVGASDEDLRLTMTVPTGGACTVSLTYSTEIT